MSLKPALNSRTLVMNLFIAMTGVCAAFVSFGAEAFKPNIIFILCDDLGDGQTRLDFNGDIRAGLKRCIDRAST